MCVYIYIYIYTYVVWEGRGGATKGPPASGSGPQRAMPNR